jgi:hypothetical protein
MDQGHNLAICSYPPSSYIRGHKPGDCAEYTANNSVLCTRKSLVKDHMGKTQLIYPYKTNTVSSGDRDCLVKCQWCRQYTLKRWQYVTGDWGWWPELGGHLRLVEWQFEDSRDLLHFTLRWK